MKNLAADPKLASIKTGLQSQLDAWIDQQGDKGMETENLADTRQGKSDDAAPKAKKSLTEDASPTKSKKKGGGKKKKASVDR